MKNKKYPPKRISELHNIKNRIICPVCKHKALYLDTVVRCTNTECGTKFPILDGIPILINEQESIFDIERYREDNTISPVSKTNTPVDIIRRLVRKITHVLPSLSMNLSDTRNFELLKILLQNKAQPHILIIGGATIRSGADIVFHPNNTVIESDIYIGPRTQMIIDGHHIPFEDSTFDLIIFQAVLEHVADPPQCVQEAHRVLKDDGLVFATTPFMQQVHMKAHDFTRYTHLGHRRLFRAFDEIESGVFAGTGVALGWSLRSFVGSLVNHTYMRKVFQMIVACLFFWLKYIDYITYKNKGTVNGAAGFYFIGRKSTNILSDKELITLYRGI